MRKCASLNCENHLSNLTLVGEKLLNTQRRKFCFTCSPLGSHNTKDLNRILNPIKSKSYKYVKSFRHKKKQKAIEYLGGCCKVCGYKKCNGALHFHHKDPNEKDFSISMASAWGFEKIRTELDKCILLCSNCHAEVHWNRDSI